MGSLDESIKTQLLSNKKGVLDQIYGPNPTIKDLTRPLEEWETNKHCLRSIKHERSKTKSAFKEKRGRSSTRQEARKGAPVKLEYDSEFKKFERQQTDLQR